MKRKLLYTAVVAAVLGSGQPAYAADYQEMYRYYYYENYELVGLQEDLCTNDGVVTQGKWIWGYGTSHVEVQLIWGCEHGQWVPLR